MTGEDDYAMSGDKLEERAKSIAREARAWKDAVMPWSPPFSDAVADIIEELLSRLEAAEADARQYREALRKADTFLCAEGHSDYPPGDALIAMARSASQVSA